MTRTASWLRTPPSRGVAFAIHLTLSLLVFSVLVLMMLLYWFPGELFFIDGGWQGLKLVAMIDLVLGPALTLLLYKPGKPRLMMDMSMIALLQIAALAYGFHTTYQQRTVALVFAERAFNTLSASDNKTADEQLLALDESPASLPPAGMLSLPMLLTPDPENHGKFLAEILNGYPPPQERSDQYVQLNEHRESMRKHALDWQALSDRGAAEAIRQVLERSGKQPEDVEYYPFRARYADGIAIFDPEQLKILDYVPDSSPTIAAASETADDTHADSTID